MHRAVPLGLRALQFLMAVTVLALAAAMIRNQVYGSSPVTTRYTTFTGGFGMIVSGIGILSVFASVPALVPIALDGLAGILFLGGGIAWAIGLKNVENCTSPDGMLYSDLLNQGSVTVGDQTDYGVHYPGDDQMALYNRLRGNCKRAQADEILQFISFGIAVGMMGVGYLAMKRGLSGRSGGGYVA